MTVEWLESYKVGDAEVDACQKQLFELTNSFLASDDLRVLRPIIVALGKQMRLHFEQEEALMRRANFPGIEAHIEQHQTLLTRLMGRSMDVGKGYMNKPAIAALMQEWATTHVPQEDAVLATYLASNA
jgi:hemerythrin-like metal-binding protein